LAQYGQKHANLIDNGHAFAPTFFLLAIVVTPCRLIASDAAPRRNDRTVTSQAGRHEGQ
jgi:hypothetical protein